MRLLASDVVAVNGECAPSPVNEAWAGAASTASAMVREQGWRRVRTYADPLPTGAPRQALWTTAVPPSGRRRRSLHAAPMTIGPRVDDGAGAWTLTRIVRAAARRPKSTIALWLLLVVGFTVGGGMVGTRTSTPPNGTGESARADQRLTASGLGIPRSSRSSSARAIQPPRPPPSIELRPAPRGRERRTSARSDAAAAARARDACAATPTTRPTTSRRSSARSRPSAAATRASRSRGRRPARSTKAFDDVVATTCARRAGLAAGHARDPVLRLRRARRRVGAAAAGADVGRSPRWAARPGLADRRRSTSGTARWSS